MRTIHKIVLEVQDVQLIKVKPLRKPDSEGIYDFKEQVIKIDEQDGKICLWYMVDEHEFSHIEEFHIVGTGHDATGLEPTEFLGTVLLMSGSLVLHVFNHKTVTGGDY